MKTRSGRMIAAPSMANPAKRKVARAAKSTRKRTRKGVSYPTVASKVSKQLNIPFRTHAMNHPLTKHLHARDKRGNAAATTVKLVPKPRTKQNPTWDDSSHDTSMSSMPSVQAMPKTPSSIGPIPDIQTPMKPQTRKRVDPNKFIKVKLKPMPSNEEDWWDI